MSNNKTWIYRGEYRAPMSGENIICGECVQTSLGRYGDKYHIVEPIPDDVVMVPREKIAALESAVDKCPLCCHDVRSLYGAANAILACADQPKECDEILEALKEARMRLRGYGEPHPLDDIIRLREKELEARQ